MYITPQSPRLRNDLYCVEWDVKLYYTIPYQWAAEDRGNGDTCWKLKELDTDAQEDLIGLYHG